MILLIIRLILIPLAYAAAVLTGAAVIAGIAFLRAYPPVAHDPVALSATAWVVFADFVVVMAFAMHKALIPSLIAIVAAEVFVIRSALYFCGAALAAAYVAARAADPAIIPSLPAEPAIAGAAACAAGFVYWLLCGRLSGVRSKAEPAHS